MNGKKSTWKTEGWKFYKALFRLNAAIDIDIDQEEPRPKERILYRLDGSKNVKRIARKAQELLGIAETEIRRSDNLVLDVALQRIWTSAETESLREKGVSLLLLTKYARAQLLTEPFRKNHDKSMNALTRFVTSNLSQLLPSDCSTEVEDFESLFLRLLLLLEAVACATPGSSLGLLLQIHDLLPRHDKEPNERLRDVAPYWDAVLKYNSALAHIHEDARSEALDDLRTALRECESVGKDKGLIAEYVLIPTLQTRADLYNKMQLGANALQDLKTIFDCTKAASYTQVKARLWEAFCRLDMGNLHETKAVVRRLRRTYQKFVPSDWFAQEEGRLPTIDLSKYPKLRLLALKLLFQVNLEERKTGQKLNSDESLQFLKILIEKETKEDRFERHNLKDFAIDWLETLVDSIEIDDEHWRNGVLKALDCLDEGPGYNAEDERRAPWKENGKIQNEIWGDEFLRLYGKERVWKVLEKLSDEAEGALRKCGREGGDGGNCPGSTVKGFLKQLSGFELRALGLKINDDNKLQFFGDDSDETKRRSDFDWVYPAKGTYLYRKIMRRGRVLVNYLRAAEHDGGCPPNGETCAKKETGGFSWLQDESDTELGIEACLTQLQSGLRRAIEPRPNLDIDQYDAVPECQEPNIPLRIKDYRHIIRDSDFLKYLEQGQSVQPVHWHEMRCTEDCGRNSGEDGFGVQFVGLRRWNSHTPELSFSKGGGYFIFVPTKGTDVSKDTTKPRHGGVSGRTRLGIVLDPGFDFIHNFFRQGFTLDDIDIVIITHGDSDHVNDFRGLADLLRVRKTRLKGGDKRTAKKIYTLMPASSRKLLARYITDPDFRRLYYDTILVELKGVEEGGGLKRPTSYTFTLAEDREKHKRPHLLVSWGDEEAESLTGLRVEVRPVAASHDDHTGDTDGAFGYVMTFGEGARQPLAVIGYTGDSQWFSEFASNFEDCDLVCSHMGSVLGDDEKDYAPGKITNGAFEALIRKKNHPYLPGEILFLEQLRKSNTTGAPERVVVLSEFGEEMKGMMRGDICRRINRCLKGEARNEGCWYHFSLSRTLKKSPGLGRFW